jgi:hypothetical protein
MISAHQRGEARHVSLVAAITQNIQIDDDAEILKNEQVLKEVTSKELDEEVYK